MKEKLLALMKSEGLKSSQLAEMLEINPAGVSHILAGRNKPGFDLLQKILRRFPRINPDWLLLDSDKMYRDDDTRRAAETAALPKNATPGPTFEEGLFRQALLSPSAEAPGTEKSPDAPSSGAVNNAENGKQHVAVERVVIFYTDQTFTSYSPTKR